MRETETKTEWEPRRGRERGKHRLQSRLQALSCQHRAGCGARTHKLWDHDVSQSWMLIWPSHPGTPKLDFLKWGASVMNSGWKVIWSIEQRLEGDGLMLRQRDLGYIVTSCWRGLRNTAGYGLLRFFLSISWTDGVVLTVAVVRVWSWPSFNYNSFVIK